MEPTDHQGGLSVIARQCVAAACLERFCDAYAIRHPQVDEFIEHLWGVASLTPESFGDWEQRFQDLPASTWDGPLPEALRNAIPEPARLDYEALANAAIECSAATWYGSDIPATLDAFATVVKVMNRHRVALPDLKPFAGGSSPDVGHGWGDPPSVETLATWRSHRVR